MSYVQLPCNVNPGGAPEATPCSSDSYCCSGRCAIWGYNMNAYYKCDLKYGIDVAVCAGLLTLPPPAGEVLYGICVADAMDDLNDCHEAATDRRCVGMPIDWCASTPCDPMQCPTCDNSS
jgi:hypothetical protein